MTNSSYGGEYFYSYMKEGLRGIGLGQVYDEKELSRIVISSGLSLYVTDISDPVSLYNLAEALGPFITLKCGLAEIDNAEFRFDVEVGDPLSGDTYLEISRFKTNWLSMDKEISNPVLNLIKKWYDESASMPPQKTHE